MNNSDKVQLSDVVAIAKKIAESGTVIPSEINVDAVTSPNETVRLDFVETGDDKGISITGGQFSVGSPNSSYESIFGEGDSYPIEVAYHYSTLNETGLTITGATDITTTLQSDSGSFVDMFATNSAEECLLFGSDSPSFGVKVKYESLGDMAPENIIGEFLDNTNTWQNNRFMATNANSPYEQVGWEIGSFLSEQVRFAQPILTPSTTWELKTLNINGQNITKYWSRARLISPVTTLAEIQQLKHHSSRTEINADGTVEFFGNARKLITLPIQNVPNVPSDPADESVVYFTGGLNGAIAKYTDNEFSANAVDSRLIIIPIAEGLDTSTDLLVSVSFYVKGTSTGNIEFTYEYDQITDGFLYNTEVNPESTITKIVNVPTDSNLLRQTVDIEIPINMIGTSTGGVLVVLSRDARPTNLNDTLANSVIITNITVKGRRWTV